jgi:hypothetical protein
MAISKTKKTTRAKATRTPVRTRVGLIIRVAAQQPDRQKG